MRLQKYMSMAGISSRRAGEKLILDGRVTVNGEKVTALGLSVDPQKDTVAVDGREVCAVPPQKAYLLLYKPAGYVATLKDEFGRPTVRDLVKDAGIRVYPVGRLDMDTSGLLLLTNDGDLSYRLTHPSFGVEKEYLARVHDIPAAETLAKLANGVRLEDGMTAPAQVRLIKAGRPTSVLSLTIREGRNRQVRRMLEAVGHPVVSLKRTRIGPLTLAGLRQGQWRRLKAGEIAGLMKNLFVP